jgi:hypothetical protein
MYAKKQIFTRGPLLILALMVMTLIALPVSAVSVRDTRIALDIEPGTATPFPVVLSLLPDEQEGDYAVDVLGLGQSPVDGNYTALPAAADTSPFSARSFITVNTPRISLKQGEQAEITATVTMPPEVKDGGWYAMIVVRPAESETGRMAGIAPEVAVPIFLTVKGGTMNETGEITALAFTTPDLGNELQVVTLVQNTGNHHYAGLVNMVTITDSTGRVLARSTSRPTELVLVPGQEAPFTNILEGGIPPGAHWITTRVEKPDGIILAEKTEPLDDSKESGDSLPAVDGFGMNCALLAITIGLLGSRGNLPDP